MAEMASAARTQQQLCNPTQPIMDIAPQPETYAPQLHNVQQGPYMGQPPAYPLQTYSVAPHQQGNFLPAQNNPSSYQQPLPNEANEWERVSTKKRSRISPDKRTTKQMRTDNYWLNPPTTTSNRFEMLDSEEDENASMNEVDMTSEEKVFKPPPSLYKG
jgi:hypothetical protein